MGKLFDLDESTKSTIRDALDDIIEEFGKDCRLVYPARFVRCANCLWDSASGRSTNRWRTGGPIKFHNTPCPLCHGEGQRAEEVSEVVKFKVEWEPKKFWLPIPNLDIRVPHSVCQIKGYLWHMPKVARCEYMVIQVPIEGYSSVKMKLSGEPISPGNIIQDRYFVCTWRSMG